MIELDRVSKSYRTRAGRRNVLDNVGATFEAGHNFGILGVNGAGKSTLIRLLAGSELPDRGIIRRSARVSFPLGFGVNAEPTRYEIPTESMIYRRRSAPVRKIYGIRAPERGRTAADFLCSTRPGLFTD